MLYQQIARNKRKTVVVMAAFVIILTLVGAGFGYLFSNTPWTGIFIALIGSLTYLFLVMRDPANMVMSLNHAQEIHEQDNPQLWHIVEDMAMVGRVPMPRVFIINDPSPNAFATGRDPDHSAVAVTQGLLDMMDREELEGVLGHEISHIRNYDIRLSTIAVVLVGVISFLSGLASRFIWFGGSDDDDDNNNAFEMIFKVVAIVFVLILGPLSASLAQMALSRNREFLADASSVELTRNPQGLISALEKIEGSQPMKQADRSSSGMYIENPFKHSGSLFDTHPPTAERIKRLQQM
ncbi:zinc metalloprotease HtpX [Lactobacillus amylovorus]|jgi:heat shock protein HtpX|uniref:Protease HtpX homolog n=2 Tax=Lactobacillus amylovorus TaxID=1604 RepID=A0A3R6B1F7_LACAM|nr:MULTISPECIES: zinc metalloprotease HtpX [Lactobacillus]CDA27279.1 protease HtpX homolog [Lactobacillus amylovorus CAG:719]HBQ08442.1 zinc metalloprotease HtpX [Lactobacillus sp.]MCI7160441.1 zinc metalloprotease HtpX [Lactobacillus amylovorus]MCT3595990.1 zinc metalloprotease HtpX [Lactobacillus amylovorus]MDB6220738.1 zinc metalloprotease HtpX [Lactobacillus amylovorus]